MAWASTAGPSPPPPATSSEQRTDDGSTAGRRLECRQGGLALLLASALAVSCGGAGEGSATTTTPTDPAVATRALLAGIAADGPGCSVAVGRGHRIVFAEARGLASLTPPRPNTRATVMDIGSTSKPFIALAILLLADEGRLSLDDDDRRDVDAACLDSESRRRSRYG